MKTIPIAASLAIGLAASAMAASFSGVVMDEKCSGIPAMKSNVSCIQTCLKGGSPAVLVTTDGKVYKISNQDKILPSAGKTVTVNGKLEGDTITVANVK